MNFAGKTVKVGSGYQIVWNAQKLAGLPPEMHDLLFFHECAHAKVPTTDEVQANCVGLKDMRAAGRAGLAVEAKLAAFYGATNGYWVNTLRCANAEPKPAARGLSATVERHATDAASAAMDQPLTVNRASRNSLDGTSTFVTSCITAA
jgi:hypothetical protein